MPEAPPVTTATASGTRAGWGIGVSFVLRRAGITTTFTSPARAGLAIVSTASPSGMLREISGSTATRPLAMSSAARVWVKGLM